MNENELPQSLPLEFDEMTVPLGELAQPLNALAYQLGKVNDTLQSQNRSSRIRTVLSSFAVLGLLVVGVLMIYSQNKQSQAIDQQKKALDLVIAENEEIKDQNRLLVDQAAERLRFAKERELSDLQHRIRKEECVIRVINDIVTHRINTRTGEQIKLCDPDATLNELKTRHDELKAELYGS